MRKEGGRKGAQLHHIKKKVKENKRKDNSSLTEKFLKRRNGDGIRSTIIRPHNLFLNFYILIQNSRKQIWRGIIIIITITSLLPFLGPFEREKGGKKSQNGKLRIYLRCSAQTGF